MDTEDRRSSVIGWPEMDVESWLAKCPQFEGDTTYDESVIEDIALEKSKDLQPDVLRTYKLVIDKYTEIGMPQDLLYKNLERIDEYLVTCLKVIHEDVDAVYDKFCTYKKDLLARLKKIREDLYLPTVDDDTANYPLVHLCQRLRSKYNTLNVVKEERMSQLRKLRDQQREHCLILGIKTPDIKLHTDIPTQEELDFLAKAVMDLAREVSNRKTKYSTLIETISKCMDQIDYAPKDDFEATVLIAEPNYTEDYLSRLSHFHSNLENQFAANQAKYEKLKTRLESLYERLDIDQKYRQRFFEAHAICKPKLMAEMQTEIDVHEELKRQNLGKFIEKIIVALKSVYNQCYVSEEIQDRFLSLTDSDDCNEQLLELCENELKRMEDYYEANKAIVQRFTEWKNLFEEWSELELNSDDPSRLNNRGGRLLKEAKQRNMLERRLPKLEAELRKMNDHVQFKIFDQDLPLYIEYARLNLKNEKELRRQTRPAKQQPVKRGAPTFATPTPTPNKYSRIISTPGGSLKKRPPMQAVKSHSDGSDSNSSSSTHLDFSNLGPHQTSSPKYT